jgi:hypothetical protein
MRASGLCAVLLLVVPIVVAQSDDPVWTSADLGTYHDSLDLAFKNATVGGAKLS